MKRQLPFLPHLFFYGHWSRNSKLFQDAVLNLIPSEIFIIMEHKRSSVCWWSRVSFSCSPWQLGSNIQREKHQGLSLCLLLLVAPSLHLFVPLVLVSPREEEEGNRRRGWKFSQPIPKSSWNEKLKL